MSEYPKQMRWMYGGLSETVEVLAPPIKGFVPVRWISSDGGYGIELLLNLSPLPSPDDEVEVVVKMTRGQRDTLSDPGRLWSSAAVDAVRDACRAHKDTEG